jgi:flagellar biosynthesis protein FlhB
MSGDSSEDKTEQASAKKLRDAHDKGQVAKSAELASSLSMLAGLMVVMAMAPWFAHQLADLFLAIERALDVPEPYALKALIFESLLLILIASLPAVAVAAGVNLLALWLQTGTVFSLDPLMPKLERLNPVSGLKNLFSMKSLVQFAQMLIKTAIVGIAVGLIALRLLPDAIRVIHADMGAALEVVKVGLTQLLLWCGGLFVMLGCADFGFQRWQFLRDQRMSKTEVKREHKEQQGDGQLKSERKRLGHEPLRDEQLKYMNMASLVLRHSDGRLVVLIYRPTAHALPLYLLRAKGEFADTVLEVASKQKVALVHDDALLASLYPGVQIASPIQAGLAPEVMAHLKRLAAASPSA